MAEKTDTNESNNMQRNNNRKTDWYAAVKSTLDSKGKFKGFMDGFSKCQTDEERVRMLYSLPGIHDILTVAVNPLEKSASDSVDLRNQGNKVFQKRYNQKALDLYNASVRVAPTSGDTSVLALALANRSAVLIHMKLYDLCLLDITSALKYGYPSNLRYKLLERRGRCYYQLRCKDQAIQAFEEAKVCLKDARLEQEKRKNLINEYDKQVWQCSKMNSSSSVSLPLRQSERFHGPVPKIENTNPVMQCVSDAVSLLFSLYSGRGLMASRDIDVGEILIVEKPYVSTLLPDHSLSYCHHCCNRVISHVACSQCSDVIFCSESCQMQAWEGYHRLECGILSAVRSADVSLGHIALRMVLKAGFSYLKDFPSDFVPTTEQEIVSAGFDENGQYNSEDYRTVYHLVNHTALRSSENLLRRTLDAVFLLKCLEKTKFFDGAETDNSVASLSDRFCVGGHILRHIQMLPCNAHEVSELKLKGTNMAESVTMEIGSAIYPVLSLINHSCDPSVVRHSYGEVCVVRAIRGIPKGTEILDNYGALYPLTKCSDRREKLATQYYFTCNCLACQDDYPLYFDTPCDMPVFKCEKCEGPVFLPMDGKSSSSSCSSCKHIQDVTKKVGVLAKSDELYRGAIQQVLMDRSGNLDGFIPTLETHLKLMDRFLCRPWRDYNDCQEALKQCYSVRANCFNVAS